MEEVGDKFYRWLLAAALVCEALEHVCFALGDAVVDEAADCKMEGMRVGGIGDVRMIKEAEKTPERGRVKSEPELGELQSGTQDGRVGLVCCKPA